MFMLPDKLYDVLGVKLFVEFVADFQWNVENALSTFLGTFLSNCSFSYFQLICRDAYVFSPENYVGLVVFMKHS